MDKPKEKSLSHNNYTFAESILYYLKDEDVEVYCGDTGETHRFSETDIAQKSIIRGKVTDALGDCLILTVVKMGLSATVYINMWNIKSIIPIKDPLFVKDIYSNEQSGLKGHK